MFHSTLKYINIHLLLSCWSLKPSDWISLTRQSCTWPIPAKQSTLMAILSVLIRLDVCMSSHMQNQTWFLIHLFLDGWPKVESCFVDMLTQLHDGKCLSLLNDQNCLPMPIQKECFWVNSQQYNGNIKLSVGLQWIYFRLNVVSASPGDEYFLYRYFL